MMDVAIALSVLLKKGQKIIESTAWSEVENQHVKVKVRKMGNGYVIELSPKDEIGEMIKETWENLCNAKDEEQKANYRAILEDLILNF